MKPRALPLVTHCGFETAGRKSGGAAAQRDAAGGARSEGERGGWRCGGV